MIEKMGDLGQKSIEKGQKRIFSAGTGRPWGEN
jgi:hypothetical protein